MTPEEIKEYCERMIARSERLLASERTSAYYEDQLRLRELWLRADQAQSQENAASTLESIRSLQLEQAESQAKQVEQADTQNALLLRLCIATEMLENLK